MNNNNFHDRSNSPKYRNQAPNNMGAMSAPGAGSSRVGANTPQRGKKGDRQQPHNSPRYDDPRNLRDQSANTRRQRKNSPPTDFEKLRRVNRHRQFKIKKKRQKRLKMFIRRAIIVFAVYLVLLTVSALIVYANMNTHMSEENFDYIYQVGVDKDPARSSSSVSRKQVYMNGTKYINFTELAELCEMTTTGDANQLRFIAANGEIVEFNLGSSFAYINDVATRLNEVTVYKDGALYVPMEFAKRYMLGVTAAYNEQTHKITAGRNGSFDIKGNFIYDSVSFVIKPQTPCANIPLESLPYNILAQTVLPKPIEPTVQPDASGALEVLPQQ